jgi:uncharacterized protein (DUF433 family)
MSVDDHGMRRSSGIIAGIPVIRGTRIPLVSLLEHLRAGKGIENFLLDHPSVTLAQLNVALICAVEALIERRTRAVDPDQVALE